MLRTAEPVKQISVDKNQRSVLKWELFLPNSFLMYFWSVNMTDSFKEKDERLVKETVDQSKSRGGVYDPGEYLSEERRITVTLNKSDIRNSTGRTVVREDALKNLATQFEQYGCTAVITND